MLCATATVHAQGGSISGQVISPAGYPVANGLVRICPTTSTGVPCTPLTPNVYSDPAETIPVANPYTTDGFGNYSVFVPAGSYYIVQVSFTSNQQPYSYNYIVAAASSAIAVPEPQYTVAIYTAPGTGSTLGASPVTGNGSLMTDASSDLIVPGTGTFFGNVGAPLFNATASPYYEVNGVQIAASNLSNGLTGSGAIVLANSPTLIAPTLGVAAGTSLTLSGFSGNVGSAVCIGTAGLLVAGGCGSVGSVTSFSAGSLSPLFTTSVATSTTTPALSFALSNAAQNSVFAGPPTGGAGAPSYQTAPTISAANMTNFPLATNSALGVAECDGTTINCASGVLSQIAPTFTGASGYQTLPSGLILQWGLATSGSNTDVPVAFPLTFPHAAFNVTFGSDNTGSNANRNACYLTTAISTTGFSVNDSGSTINCRWFAVGW